MNDENYITIQGWMVNRLGLTGNDLLTFAIIYGFSQDGEGEFKGSSKYIMGVLGCCRNTCDKSLIFLEENGLIVKWHEEINNMKMNRYRANLELIFQKKEGISNSDKGMSKFDRGISNSDRGGISKFDKQETNNIEYNKKIKEKASSEKKHDVPKSLNTDYGTKEFIDDWNEVRSKTLKKPSHLKTLGAYESKSAFTELSKVYERQDFINAMTGLFKQRSFPNGNTVMNSNPKHLLTHFETYLSAFHDKNAEIYGKQQERFL